MKKICGIYCFENILNGHKYIGQSNNIESRRKNHLSTLKNGKDDCLVFQKAYDKYGESGFKFWIVEECSLELLNERETYWIKELHSHVSEGGYNVSYGGDSGMRGRKHSEESKKKMSEWQRGENGYWYGKKLPQETIAKIVLANTGRTAKPASEETRKKMSVAGKKSKQGVKKNSNYTSKYVGVYKHAENKNSWCVHISLSDGERVFLGCFKTEVEAAMAYNEMAIEEYGWKAKLNNIQEDELNYVWNNDIDDKKVRGSYKKSSSKYSGVSWDKNKKKWVCTVNVPGEKQVYGGAFKFEIEAALAWNEIVLELFGYKMNNRLNIITPEEIENLWNQE